MLARGQWPGSSLLFPLLLLCVGLAPPRPACADERVLHNVLPVDSTECLAKLREMELKTFSYLSAQFDKPRFSKRREMGLIAQEVRKLLPESVATVPSFRLDLGKQGARNLDGFMLMDKDMVFWNHLGATQELTALHDGLRAEVDNTTSAMARLKANAAAFREFMNRTAHADLVERRKTAEAKVREAELEVEREKTKGEEERKTLEHKREQEEKAHDYQDRLARERQDIDDGKARSRNKELVGMQEESSGRQEHARMENEMALEKLRAKHALEKAQVERDTAVQKAAAEAEGRIKQERENEDIAMRRLEAQAKADSEKLVRAVKTFLAIAGRGIAAFLMSPAQMFMATVFVGAAFLCIFVGRELVKIVGTEVTRRLRKPQLLRETSASTGRHAIWRQVLRSVWETGAKLGAALRTCRDGALGLVTWAGQRARAVLKKARAGSPEGRRRVDMSKGKGGTGAKAKAKAKGRSSQGQKGKKGETKTGEKTTAGPTKVGEEGEQRKDEEEEAEAAAPAVSATTGGTPGLAHSDRGVLKGIVLEEELAERVQALAKSIANSRKHNAPLRHFMFYGPPGTGKTMVAKRLAHTTGLDYAIMTGGDVVPLGKDAVTELHTVFDWAKRSRRGLILFIDEAEAFLGSRSRGAGLSEALRNAVSAILYHTGEQQKAFMLVLTTNRPGDLDMAVADRIDESLEFQVPNLDGRAKLVEIYFKKYIGSRAYYGTPAVMDRLRECFGTTRIQLTADITPELFRDVATRLEGFSGREIAKLILGLQAYIYGQDHCILNAKMMLRRVEQMANDQRKKWKLLEKKTVWS